MEEGIKMEVEDIKEMMISIGRLTIMTENDSLSDWAAHAMLDELEKMAAIINKYKYPIK